MRLLLDLRANESNWRLAVDDISFHRPANRPLCPHGDFRLRPDPRGGRAWTGLVKECHVVGQSASDSLTVELVAKIGQPILSALEIVPLAP